MTLILPQQSNPSYKNGFARSAAESQFPELWKGLVGAWVPMLGSTGAKLKNIVGTAKDPDAGLLMGDASWSTTRHGLAVNLPGTPTSYIRLDNMMFGNVGSVVSFFTNVGSSGTAREFMWAGKISWTSTSNATLRYRDFNADSGSVRIENSYGMSIRQSTMPSYVDDKLHSAVATFESPTGSTDFTLWWDGGFEKSNVGSGDIVDLGFLEFGARAGTVPTVADHLGTLVYSRVLQPTEIKHLHKDPLAPFRKKIRIPYNIEGGEPPQPGFKPHWGSPITRLLGYWN